MAPEDEKRIIAQCMRERLPLPHKIQNAPELWAGLELYFGAFLDLNTCRQIGMGMAPISWLAINEYAMVNDFDDEQREDLFYFIGVMDKTFLDHHARKTETKPVKPAKTPVKERGKRFA